MTTFSDIFVDNKTPLQSTIIRANDTSRTGQLNQISAQLDTTSASNYTFVQSGTPSATQSGETWLDTDDGKVYNSTGSGTGNWVFAYQVVLVDTLNHVPNKQNDLNLIGSAGGYGSETFTRSTVVNHIDRYGIVQQAGVDNPAFEKEGLLLEGASTNQLLHSKDHSDVVWVKAKTPSSTTETAPDGTGTAYKVTGLFSGGGQVVRQSVTYDFTDDIATGSFFLKGISGQTIVFQINNTDKEAFNRVTHTFTGGWDRVENKVDTDGATNNNYQFFITVLAASTATEVTYWGGQLEHLPFMSSFIITTVSSVTRTVNKFEIPYTNNFSAPGDNVTVIVDFDFLGVAASNDFIFGVPGETSRFMMINSGDLKLRLAHGSTFLQGVTALVAGAQYRAAYVNDGTNLLLYLNGVFEASIAQGTVTGTASRISVGMADAAGNATLHGHISNFKIINQALTASEIRI